MAGVGSCRLVSWSDVVHDKKRQRGKWQYHNKSTAWLCGRTNQSNAGSLMIIQDMTISKWPRN